MLIKKVGKGIVNTVGLTVLLTGAIILIIPYTLYQGFITGPDPKKRRKGDPVPVFNL